LIALRQAQPKTRTLSTEFSVQPYYEGREQLTNHPSES